VQYWARELVVSNLLFVTFRRGKAINLDAQEQAATCNVAHAHKGVCKIFSLNPFSGFRGCGRGTGNLFQCALESSKFQWLSHAPIEETLDATGDENSKEDVRLYSFSSTSLGHPAGIQLTQAANVYYFL
jgi:hypothetical protein